MWFVVLLSGCLKNEVIPPAPACPIASIAEVELEEIGPHGFSANELFAEARRWTSFTVDWREERSHFDGSPTPSEDRFTVTWGVPRGELWSNLPPGSGCTRHDEEIQVLSVLVPITLQNEDGSMVVDTEVQLVSFDLTDGVGMMGFVHSEEGGLRLTGDYEEEMVRTADDVREAYREDVDDVFFVLENLAIYDWIAGWVPSTPEAYVQSVAIQTSWDTGGGSVYWGEMVADLE